MTTDAPTIILVACEESGDNYGATIAREIKAKQPNARLIGLGGPKMQAAGVEVLINMVDHSVMGFSEVLSSIGFFLNAMKVVVEVAEAENADAALLIDSPDFNLRIAPKLKAAGLKISYFISPQMWIWRSNRVKQVERYIDDMMCIMPFEQEWYAERGVEAHYVGHPLMDTLDFDAIRAAGAEVRSKALDGKKGPLIGLLPGSRGFEVKRLLPRFLKAGRLIKEQYPQARFAIGCSHWLNPERAQEMTARFADLGLHLEHNNTHAVMAAADTLLSCSGTACLEAALIGTPMVMAYHLKWFTYFYAKTFYFNNDTLFSLPNIILGREAIPEMIQMHTEPTTLALSVMEVFEEKADAQRESFRELREMLAGDGACQNAANRLLALIQS